MHEKQKLSPPELARLWGISSRKVIRAIRRGELRAIDIAEPGCLRPRYLIDLADVADFEKSRRVIPDGEPRATQKPRRKPRQGVKEFF